jgi:hypothetical protein
MKHLCVWFGAMVFFAACTSTNAPTPTIPSLTPVSSTISPSVQVTAAAPTAIIVGKDITGTLQAHGAETIYELTAGSTGTLVAQLNWTPTQGRLQLDLADRIFAHYPENVSPLIGKLAVSAGGTYRIRVSDGAPWDYDVLSLRYVLTTAIE